MADQIRKTVLILKPLFNVPANRCAIRTLLIDRGFIIVREEERLIVGDVRNTALGNTNGMMNGNSSSSSSNNNNGNNNNSTSNNNNASSSSVLLSSGNNNNNSGNNSNGSSTTSECTIYVVARENAVETLRQLLNDNQLTDADAVTPADDAAAASTLTLLFPRMKKDLIPSTESSVEYLDKELKTLLVRGFTELAKQKPENAVEAMAHWLLENNPHRGTVPANKQ